MNVVRFKLKSDCVDKYFEVIDKTRFEGMTQSYIAKTGDYDYCFVGIWKSADAIAAQRPAMIAHLNEVRGFMEELSPEPELLILFQGILFLKLVIMIDTRFKKVP